MKKISRVIMLLFIAVAVTPFAVLLTTRNVIIFKAEKPILIQKNPAPKKEKIKVPISKIQKPILIQINKN